MSTKEVWKRLLGFLWQFKGLLLISFICAAISVWLNVLAPLLIGNIIDRITALHDIRSILKDVALLVAVYGFYSVFNWGMMYASNKIAFSCSCVLRKQLYEKIERLPISFYDKNAKGDLISRFVNDVDFISDGFLQGLSTILSGGVTIVLSLYFMLRVNWIMALIVWSRALYLIWWQNLSHPDPRIFCCPGQCPERHERIRRGTDFRDPDSKSLRP